MTTIIENTAKVKEFMLTSGQYVGTVYGICKENINLIDLREELIREELNELRDAVKEDNKIEILDAICDIEYVLLGAMITFGIRPEEIVVHDFELYENIEGLLEMNKTIFKNIKLLRNKQILELDFSNLYADLVIFRRKLSNKDANYDYLFKRGFDRVHESNMTKFCSSIEEARATCLKYDLQGVFTYFDKVRDFYVVKRSSDSKVLKSVNYQPVNLSDLV